MKDEPLQPQIRTPLPAEPRQAARGPDVAKTGRRRFLQRTAGAVAACSLAALDISRFAHAAAGNRIRLGLVGCGGRGAGAAFNALSTGRDVTLVALADLFEDRFAAALNQLQDKIPADQLAVSRQGQYLGFDAFEQLLAHGVDAVIFATPSGFRPIHFEAAVRAGVHCFLEKSAAVDAPGIRRVRAAAESARKKGLSVVVGLQDRSETVHQQIIAEIAGGRIGRVTRQEATVRLPSLPVKSHRSVMEKSLGRRLSEMEWQIRNWLAFVWLSGDYILEVLVHQLDTCLWATGRIPISAKGVAERREHQGDDYGNVHDFLSVTYRYDDGVELAAEVSGVANAARQWQSRIEGEKGIAVIPGTIVDSQGRILWQPSVPKNDPWQEEMNQWCASIRDGTELHSALSAADSTLAAIMGRTAAYTGREITWGDITASTETFFTHNPKSFQDGPPDLPDKFGDYIVPPRGRPS